MRENDRRKLRLLMDRFMAAGALVAGLLIGGVAPAQAQYLGLNLRGDMGLKSGSQAGPGYYFILPVFYRSDYGKLIGPQGSVISGNADVSLSSNRLKKLDMWGHEIVAGTTVYLDNAKSWHVAATMAYDMYQRQRTKDINVGDFLTVEGGVGRSFLKGAASAGMAYVMQWKTTDDTGSDIPASLPRGRNKVYGIGPEVNMPFFAKGTLVGLVGFRYTFEFNNSTNFQGNNLMVTITLAKLRGAP